MLDPFAGCATTCVAAERQFRHWVGIDINDEAADVLRKRLRDESNIPNSEDITVLEQPPARTDTGETAAPELVLSGQSPQDKSLSPRQLREALILRDGMKCQGCGWTPHHADYLHNDHNVPKAHGGSDAIRNRTLLCSPCNGVKSKKLTLAELRERRLDEGRMMDATWNRKWMEKVGRHGAPA